ncbi:MAG: FHA domain-containing protein [Myxococcales bacterium]|nr:FHA domain-containing protein [Myxococcota bacterium]MDW8282593.1 FHA domain-containing protein [Myxococcales bacterium]
MLRGLGLLALLWLCLGAEALASKPKCRLERAIRLGDRLEVLASVVELEGDVVDKSAAEYRLFVDRKSVGRAIKAEPFERTRTESYIVLAVEISALYAGAIEPIKEALHALLESLPAGSKVKLILFGTEIDEHGAFMPPAALESAIDEINPDDEGDIQLVNALYAGLRALNKVKERDREQRLKDREAQKRPPPRTLMIVLSDGLNQIMDRRRFRQLGDDLRRAGVPLFPIAFSPRDDRGPLLNLGELAKRSIGTFRWAEKPENLKERFLSLAEELRQGQVLTFSGREVERRVPEDLSQVVLRLQCGDLVSNPLRSGDVPIERPSVWWKYLLGGLGALTVLWALAQGAAFLLRRRVQRLTSPSAGPQLAQPYSGGYPAGTGGHPVLGGQPAVRPAAGMLIMIDGQLAGQRIPVGDGLVLGKAVTGPGTLAILDDPTVSGRHCELRRHGPGFVLVDLGSTNGTFVNEQRLTAPTAIQDGDLVRLGTGTRFKFRLD